MKNIIELHLIQNFAPSNLNRDDTGSPKDAMFGGVRRARISSQCLKRAIRRHFDVGPGRYGNPADVGNLEDIVELPVQIVAAAVPIQAEGSQQPSLVLEDEFFVHFR